MEDFKKYIEHGEPSQREKANAWATAVGLQDVDGLSVSPYLLDNARSHIEGEISIEDVQSRLRAYYQIKDSRGKSADDNEEADRAAANIVHLLGQPSFVFSLAGLQAIHRRIFDGVFTHAGKFRDCDITKREWVLDGDTIMYGMASELVPTVEYDLSVERQADYSRMSEDERVEHLAHFTAGLWQIHPFREGNTRATAVFLIKYLRQMGYEVDNDLFSREAFYFRNALVRANYRNIPRGISADISYLVKFLRCLLTGETAELRNRDLHI